MSLLGFKSTLDVEYMHPLFCSLINPLWCIINTLVLIRAFGYESALTNRHLRIGTYQSALMNREHTHREARQFRPRRRP
jgi:hypothetical protein